MRYSIHHIQEETLCLFNILQPKKPAIETDVGYMSKKSVEDNILPYYPDRIVDMDFLGYFTEEIEMATQEVAQFIDYMLPLFLAKWRTSFLSEDVVGIPDIADIMVRRNLGSAVIDNLFPEIYICETLLLSIYLDTNKEEDRGEKTFMVWRGSGLYSSFVPQRFLKQLVSMETSASDLFLCRCFALVLGQELSSFGLRDLDVKRSSCMNFQDLTWTADAQEFVREFFNQENTQVLLEGILRRSKGFIQGLAKKLLIENEKRVENSEVWAKFFCPRNYYVDEQE